MKGKKLKLPFGFNIESFLHTENSKFSVCSFFDKNKHANKTHKSKRLKITSRKNKPQQVKPL